MTVLATRSAVAPRGSTGKVARSPWWRRGAVIAAVAAPVIFLLLRAWAQRWNTEDAFIDFRVVRNLLDGNGPVYNAGDRVEAYTSPLWVGLLAAGTWVTRVRVEWVAVALGLLSTAAALAGGTLAAMRLQRLLGTARPWLPAGAAVVAALPPFWDFTTSGLETGLELAWLAGGFALLVSLLPEPGEERRRLASRRGLLAAFCIGLGPLVRPDFLLITLVWGIVAVLICQRPTRGAALRWLGALVALPLAYEIFRMGYFASLLPNTALAKEATSARWQLGWDYLRDFGSPYWLWIPVLLLGALTAARLWRRQLRSPAAIVVFGNLIAAALAALYIVRVGGDFMHARMLLPALFCALLPVFAIGVNRWREVVIPIGILGWAVVCALMLRVPYHDNTTVAAGVVDERAFYAHAAHNPNPVTTDDYRTSELGKMADYLAGLEDVIPPHFVWLSADDGAPAADVGRNTFYVQNFGVVGYMLPDRIFIVDGLSLADALGSHLEAVFPDGRPGHQKLTPRWWIGARYTLPGSIPPASPLNEVSADIALARSAIDCGTLGHLLHATSAPLTLRGFFSNIAHSWSYTWLRVPVDPRAALAQLGCSGP